MGLGYEAEIPAEHVALVVTSPPYWHIKGYGVSSQIGYGQTLHEYLYDLSRVWRECWRVLMSGRRLREHWEQYRRQNRDNRNHDQ